MLWWLVEGTHVMSFMQIIGSVIKHKYTVIAWSHSTSVFVRYACRQKPLFQVPVMLLISVNSSFNQHSPTRCRVNDAAYMLLVG